MQEPSTQDIRRALITGAMSRIAGYARQNSRATPWLQDKLDRKPKMVAAVAPANKMARQIWAMIIKEKATNPNKPQWYKVLLAQNGGSTQGVH